MTEFVIKNNQSDQVKKVQFTILKTPRERVAVASLVVEGGKVGRGNVAVALCGRYVGV